MPKEHKKRGRRAEKKRKLEAEDDGSSKRQRHEAQEFEENTDYVAFGENSVHQEGTGQGDRPFYGLLDEKEQEQFRLHGEMLEQNLFEDAAERDAFLETVYQDAEGKELKLANSQSCSRMMERLIQVSPAAKLKKIFQSFRGK